MEKFVDQAQFIEACQELKSSLAKLGDIIDKLPEKDFEKNFKPEQKQSCIEEHSNWVRTEYSYCPSCGCELLNPRPSKP